MGLPLNQISLGLPQRPAKQCGSFPLKLYFYEEFLIMKGVAASLRNCCLPYLNKISVKHCISKLAFLELSN